MTSTDKLDGRQKLPPLSLTQTITFPSYNPDFPPPLGAKQVFELSQDYPETYETEDYPWLKIDFRKEPDAYIKTVLAYALEGNLEVNFRGQENKIRKWYHAPWLHFGDKGREYINGLTRERAAPPLEIHDQQDEWLENWAVGMYNAPGGYTLGQVWKVDSNVPKTENADFPEGTVSFKLLFTGGTVDKVPFLENTLMWEANIYENNGKKLNEKNMPETRVNKTVRLLQIDIAVKDNRSTDVGWVFGTFMYDASQKGSTVWDRMVPVGLSWGDDPTVTKDREKKGAYVNNELQQSYINEALIRKNDGDYGNRAYVKYHGVGGRLNGPVDNPVSSCISCHSQAGINKEGQPMRMGAFGSKNATTSIDTFKVYFDNEKSGAYTRSFYEKEYTTTDYSLQISGAIRNYYIAQQSIKHANKTKKPANRLDKIEDELDGRTPDVSRGGN